MSASACGSPTAAWRMPGSRSSTATCLPGLCLAAGAAMALKVNLAQINSAARGNSDLRETLTGIHLALQSLYAADRQHSFNQGGRQCRGVYRAAGGGPAYGDRGQWEPSVFPSRPRARRANAVVYQEISSSPAATFVTGVTTYPVSSNTSLRDPQPGGRRSTGACGRVTTRSTGAAIRFRGGRSARG